MAGPSAFSASGEAARRFECLIRLRWAAMVGMVVALELADHALSIPVSWLPICLTLAVLGPYNLLLAELVGGSRHAPAATRSGRLSRATRAAETVASAPVHLFRAWLAAGELVRALPGWVGARPRRDPDRTHRATLPDLVVPREYWGMECEDRISRMALLAGGQLTVDVVALAALTHFSGGLENPFVYCATVPILIAGTMLSRRATTLLAALALVLASLVGLGEMAGVLQHHPQPLLGNLELYRSPLFVAGQSVVLGTVLFLTALLSTGSAAERHSLEREVAILKDEAGRKKAHARPASAGAELRPHARFS